jgi:predicted dehydrogenase
MVDLIMWTTGLKPVEVSASLAFEEGVEVDVGGIVTMKLEGEVLGQVSSFLRMDRGRDEAYYYGTEGSIAVVRPFPFQIGFPPYRRPYEAQVAHTGSWVIEHRDASGNLVEPGELPPAYTTTENFIDAILGRDENRASGEEGVWTVKVIEGAYESARTGRKVSLE